MVVEVFQPVVVAGLSNLAGATSILAFAWLALLWRSGPAAFAHKFARACSVVEVLLPVLQARVSTGTRPLQGVKEGGA